MAVLGKQITIYGDRKQVRDVLFIDDLIRAFDELAYENKDCISGKALNIYGGPQNTLSLHELIRHLETERGKQIPLTYDNWLSGDQ